MTNIINKVIKDSEYYLVKGGNGSGNFGHAGRPGSVGGSGEGGSVNATGNNIGKMTAQQAKKAGYSFDEWFNSQGDIVYRGVGGKKKENILRDTIGPGRYFSTQKAVASEYGKIEESSFDGLNIKRFNIINEYEDLVQPTYLKLRANSPIWDGTLKSAIIIMSEAKKVTNDRLADKGFDGISTEIHTGENISIVFPKSIDKIKTKSKLKAEWDSKK